MDELQNIIFLDFDGVLNCELFYIERHEKESYKEAKKELRKSVKKKEISREEYYDSQLCKVRIGLLNGLCEQTNSQVVISSTWRGGKTVAELQKILNNSGATFTVLDKTGHCECRIRGCEIKQWLAGNCIKYFGVHSSGFYRYAIIDDDSDMLLDQAQNFFHVDNYSGLTPNTTYKIQRFLNSLK